MFEPKLKEEGCYDLFREVEMPLMPVLAWMERNGVCIDTEALKETSTLYTKEMNRLEGVSAKVNLKKKTAVVSMEKEVEDMQLQKAVEQAGYKVIQIR